MLSGTPLSSTWDYCGSADSHRTPKPTLLTIEDKSPWDDFSVRNSQVHLLSDKRGLSQLLGFLQDLEASVKRTGSPWIPNKNNSDSWENLVDVGFGKQTFKC